MQSARKVFDPRFKGQSTAEKCPAPLFIHDGVGLTASDVAKKQVAASRCACSLPTTDEPRSKGREAWKGVVQESREMLKSLNTITSSQARTKNIQTHRSGPKVH
jgi:hypothetical protein